MDHLLSALTQLADPWALLALAVGTLGGMMIGIVPGLGPSIAVALALPFTIGMDLVPSIALLMGLYCASIYGGSLSAILLNVPGTPASAVTCLDGYPMARRGEADLAIGIATVASVAGGLLSLLVLALAAPFLARFALRFGPLEMSLVGIFALTCIIIIERRFAVRALAAALIGLLIGAIGQDPMSGSVRLTFGQFQLTGGVPLVPLLIGLFAMSEVAIQVARMAASSVTVLPVRVGFRLPGAGYWRHGVPLLAKSSTLGTAVGILPGAGPTAASFMSYSEAKRTAKSPETFGKGNPDGIAASEAANNSVTGGALVPSLSLGIPGDPITAIILTALVLQGIAPGPRLYTENYDIVLVILLALAAVNVAILVMGSIGAHLFTRVLRTPQPLLLAAVVVVGTLGTYAANNSLYELKIMVAAAVLGVALRVLSFPIAPLIIGFVLAPMIEMNMRQAIIVYAGDWGVFVDRPIAGGLLLLILTLVLYPPLKALALRRLRRTGGQAQG